MTAPTLGLTRSCVLTVGHPAPCLRAVASSAGTGGGVSGQPGCGNNIALPRSSGPRLNACYRARITPPELIEHTRVLDRNVGDHDVGLDDQAEHVLPNVAGLHDLPGPARLARQGGVARHGFRT